MDFIASHVLCPLTTDAMSESLPPEWVHLIPAGTFFGRDGRGPYRLDAEAVLLAFAKGGIDLPIDYEHQSLEASDKAGPVPAAGWIKELEAREDGLWGRIEWTPRAIELLTNKEYRFISPVFRHDKKGRILALLGAGLTHAPNLDLTPAVHNQGDPMNELIEKLTYMLNLPVGSTAEDIIVQLQKLIDKLNQAEAAAAQAQTPDPSRWVPMDQYRLVTDELMKLQYDIAEQKAKEAVEAAMSAGKISPAMKDWALEYARRDLNGFADFVKAAPPILTQDTSAHRVAPNVSTLTEEDRYVIAALGLSEADYIAHKQALIKE